MDNVFATFHTAGVTHEARRNMATIAAEQILGLLAGRAAAAPDQSRGVAGLCWSAIGGWRSRRGATQLIRAALIHQSNGDNHAARSRKPDERFPRSCLPSRWPGPCCCGCRRAPRRPRTPEQPISMIVAYAPGRRHRHRRARDGALPREIPGQRRQDRGAQQARARAAPSASPRSPARRRTATPSDSSTRPACSPCRSSARCASPGKASTCSAISSTIRTISACMRTARSRTWPTWRPTPRRTRAR